MDKQGGRNVREAVAYIICGVLTTLVYMAVFEGLEWWLAPLWAYSHLLTNPIAFVAALIFAFIANKIYVFRQKNWEPRIVLREAMAFAAARLFSFGLDYVLTHAFFKWWWPGISVWFTPFWENTGLPFSAEKIYRFGVKWGFIAALTVGLNYILSKFYIFRSPAAAAEENNAIEEDIDL